MSMPIERPDEDDSDLLTFGEAGARLATEIQAGRKLLEELEQRLLYVGEDKGVAAEIARVEQRIEALQEAQARLASPPNDRVAAEIERGTGLLEQLEERFFYVGEDSELASQIAALERRLEALQRAQDQSARPPDELLAAEIEEGTQRLQQLEARFFYVAEDSQLASEIAILERHLEALKATQQQRQHEADPG
jgi:chromosome segregation ATPase